MSGKPILIFGNKTDLPNAMTANEIKEKLCLDEIALGRDWHLQMTSCANGSGISDGLEWVASHLGVPESNK